MHRTLPYAVFLSLAAGIACGSSDASDGTVDPTAPPGSSPTAPPPVQLDASAPAVDGAAVGPDAGSVPDDASTDPLAAWRYPAYAPGVNISGAEFRGSGYPGRYGYDYSYPKDSDIDYLASRGLRIMRVPFRWIRIQPELGGELLAEEVERLTHVVSYVRSKGIAVLLDTHDYASRGGVIGSGEPGAPTKEQFADYWSRLANLFKADSGVYFGLMNEPHAMTATLWLEDANAAIAGIRAVGAKNALTVPGVRWTGAHSWYVGGDESSAAVMDGVVDPLENYIYEMHQYLDRDSSGTNDTCVSTTIGVERLAKATAWLKEKGKRAMIGEIGVSQNETCLAALDATLTFMDENRDVWAGWTYWSAGSRWPDGYAFSVQPLQNTTTDRPQMTVLLTHLL